MSFESAGIVADVRRLVDEHEFVRRVAAQLKIVDDNVVVVGLALVVG